jgi:translation initiation factor eIF-2B subunit beta
MFLHFSIMVEDDKSRVPFMYLLQVLVGAHAVLANGGVICPCGINMVALAAHKHSVPFVVLVGLHKLSPLFPHDPDLVYNGG